MDPHLAKLQREIAASITELSPEQLKCGLPGKWSSAEILEHLYLTYTGTIRGFGRVLAEGKPLASKVHWKHRGRALVVVGFGYMPTGRKSPAIALPNGIAPERVSADIATAIVQMDELMSQCASRFGPRVKVLDHPVLGPLSVAQWRKFHFVHGMHHVKQIHRLREMIDRGMV